MTGRLRALGGVLAALGVSITATRISTVALPWFVLVSTGSAARTGLVAAAELAPYVLVKAFSGPLVDRVGPRRVSWVSDLLSAVSVALVPLLYAAGRLEFPVLLGMVALIGAARGPGDLAKEIMVPEAADRAGVPLERATGLSGVVERLSQVAGPAVGGTVVAVFGSMTALWINAGLFALGSMIIALTLPRGMGGPVPHPDGAEAAEPGYWRRLGEGIGFLRRQPLLLAIGIMLALTNLLDMAFAGVLLPVWAKESGEGPAAIGVLMTVSAVMAVLGSLIAATLGERMPRRPVFFLGFLVVGAPRFLILAMDAPMWAIVAVVLAAGFASGFLNPILGAVTFELVPRPMLGRVWAGIAYFLTTNLAALRSEWRTMDRPKPPETQPARSNRDAP